MKLTLITAFLCWISVSDSEFHTVEVQPGPEVTLLCSNFSSFPSHIHWFKLDNGPNISCISSMLSYDSNVSYCEGPKHGKFTMTSNKSTIFLRIKEVDSSDSGLYFCGFPSNGKPAIVSGTHLKVQDSSNVHPAVNSPATTTVILTAVTVFLIIVVTALAVKISDLQTANNEGNNPQQSEDLDPDELRDRALVSYTATIRSRRPAAEREVDTRVVYTASG